MNTTGSGIVQLVYGCRSDAYPAQGFRQIGFVAEYVAGYLYHFLNVDVRLVEAVEQHYCGGAVGVQLVYQSYRIGQVVTQLHDDGYLDRLLDVAQNVDVALLETAVSILYIRLQCKDIDFQCVCTGFFYFGGKFHPVGILIAVDAGYDGDIANLFVIIFREVPVPEIKDNQVLVKIMNIGICGSDIHVYHGKHPFTKYPVTQGHEVSGEVVKTGDAVTEFHVGQKVTIEPQVYCGHCYPCRHGKYNLCEELKVMGFQTTGTASEYFAVDASKVTPIPEDMSYEEGAMIEPLAVAVHGVKQTGDVTGMNIVVIGAGPIGNLVAQSAKGMGAAKVMITDVSDLRLEKAKECGIDVCVNTRNKNFGEAMVEAFGPDKADVIYDCAGNNITMGQAIKYARKGSVIVLVAVFAGMAEIDLAVANDHELDIKSTMMYRHDDYVDGIRLVNEGKVHLRPLISKTFAFKDYLKAYQYIDDNRETTMKVIINVQEK